MKCQWLTGQGVPARTTVVTVILSGQAEKMIDKYNYMKYKDIIPSAAKHC
jgi:hypothetical protein